MPTTDETRPCKGIRNLGIHFAQSFRRDGRQLDTARSIRMCEAIWPRNTNYTGRYAFADAGIEFEFGVTDFAPNPFTPVRYIRFRTISTYANASFSTVHIVELSFGEKL